MNFKPFFVHYNPSAGFTKLYGHHPRGFTVYVEPGVGERELSVRATFCSSKDQFCKKEGRLQALAAEATTINPRDLGKFLMVYSCDVHGVPYDPAMHSTSWDYLYKYMV